MDVSRGHGAADDVWACIARHMTARHLSRRVHEEPTQLDEVLDRFFSLDALSLPGHVVPFPPPVDACRSREEFDEWVFDPPLLLPSSVSLSLLPDDTAAAAELEQSTETAGAREMLRISQPRSEALAAFHLDFLERVARVRGLDGEGGSCLAPPRRRGMQLRILLSSPSTPDPLRFGAHIMTDCFSYLPRTPGGFRACRLTTRRLIYRMCSSLLWSLLFAR